MTNDTLNSAESEPVYGLDRAVVVGVLKAQTRWLWTLLGLTSLSLLAVGATVVTIKSVFDDALTPPYTKSLDDLVGTLFFLAVVSFLVSVPLRLVGSRVVYQLEYDLRCWMYERLQALDPRRFDRLTAGQLVTRALTDLNFLEQLTAVLPVVLVGLVIVTAIAVVMIIINPLMGVVALVAIPVNVVILLRMAGRLQALSWLTLHRRAQVTTAIDEAVRGIRVVKAFGAETREANRVAAAAGAAFDVAMTRIRLLARYGIPVKIIPLLSSALLVYLGARLTVGGAFSIGSLVVYLGFAAVLTALATQLDDALSAYQFAVAGGGRIFELLDRGDQAVGAGRAVLPVPPTSGLAVRSAAPLGGPCVELELAPGGWAAVTGPEGAALSTVARMIGGAEPIDSGTIELDGIGLDQLDVEDLRQAVRLLEAEPFLFGRTVRENLLMGGRGRPVPEQWLRDALAAAGADGFVEELAEGIDTPIGDRGLTLSGGQRQRLALARALVVPPRLLVLDDALSAVDPALEVRILRRLRAHAPSTTVVTASRRPGPLALAETRVELPAPPVTPTDASRSKGPETSNFERPADPGLAAAVDALDVATVSPGVAEDVATDDSVRPTLLRVTRPSSRRITVAAVLLFVLSMLTVGPSGLLAYAVDGIRRGDAAPATNVAMLLVPIAVAVSLVTYLLRIVVTQVNETVLYLLRRRVFQRLVRLGVDYYDRELPGRVASRVVYDLDRITEFVSSGVYQLASSIFLLLTAGALLAVVSPTTFVGVAPFIPLMILLTAGEVPLADRAYRAARERLGDVVERFQEDFAGRHVIATFGGQQSARLAFGDRSWDLRQARRRAANVTNVYLALIEMLSALATAVLISRAGHLALSEKATLGSVVFLQVLLTQALAPIPALSGVLQNYLNARASFRELGQPFETPVLPATPDGAGGGRGQPPAPTLDGSLALEHVAFTYPGTDRPVLRDLSLRLEPGELVAVVGPTGAGKSSVAKLLGRLYDPDSGRVSADGHDIRTFDLHSYRRRLGIVPQDAFCFRGTVASNIAYGDIDASRDKIHSALVDSGGADVLDSLPDGLDTAVEEEGHNLSPVIRQWIALARAWLVDPDVLVLDEATSVLPADAERAVIDALRRRRRTAVFVTHRLEVAQHADRVVVVDRGKIVQEGAPAELADAPGSFVALWSAAASDTAEADPASSDDEPRPGAAVTVGRSEPAGSDREQRDRAAWHSGSGVELGVRALDLHYGANQVLFGIDLEVRKGDVLALLGTNGAGKSSLLRAVSGVSPPSHGEVRFDGHDLVGLDPAATAALGLVQVPGGRGVFPALSVAENLRVAAWLFRQDAERTEASIARVLGLFPVLHRRWNVTAGELSGGEQQMVTLAQALMAKPRLLLIDELSLGLAPTVVGQLVDVVRGLRDDGVTIVMVEQSLNVALAICDRAVFMDKGQICFEGRAEELAGRPDLIRSVFIGAAPTGPTPRATTAASGLAGRGAPVPPDAPTTLGLRPAPAGSASVGSASVVSAQEHPLLDVRSVRKRHGGIVAVDEVSFSVGAAEVIGILGGNGAGKSTLFDLISGRTRPEAGTVWFAGDDVSAWSSARRARHGLGRCFQDAALFGSLTVQETILVALEATVEVRDPLAAALRFPVVRRDERRLRARSDELVDLLGLGPWRDQRIEALSTGTRRMVDLAGALAHAPRLLLLDEPSAGMAQAEVEALMPKLREVHDATGAAVLVIDHDVPLLQALCDRLLALESGRLIADGAPDQVLVDPAVVDAYLGEDLRAIERSNHQPATVGS